MEKVLVAMSGGVDSSAVAVIMKNQGYDPIGVTMRLHGASCVSEGDISDAQSVCSRLGIEHRVVDFSSDFEKYVIEPFVSSYENGATPNPCIECNYHLKFKGLVNYAREMGASKIATGHYAVIEYSEKYKRLVLKKARDLSKDQTYVLYRIPCELLSSLLFPLGEITDKSVTREIAKEAGLGISSKKDSQDICFVPNGDYASFIEGYRGRKYEAGDFVRVDGRVLGRHKGIIRYTVGQRKGLGLALERSMYVVSKELDTNRVIIGDTEDLMARELWADNVNLLCVDSIDEPMRVLAKCRYKQSEQYATANMENGLLHLVFDEPQRAICKGQSVVLYDKDTVVGGGIITKVKK